MASIWAPFCVIMAWLMFVLPGDETIPYHLIWASFALVYGLYQWSAVLMRIAFWAVTVVTAIPIVRDASSQVIGWEECSEIALMALIVAVAMWHIDRNRAINLRQRLLARADTVRSDERDLTARLASHEVRTRLTVARGLVEIIRSTTQQEGIRSDADVVLSELGKATATATQSLALVRLEVPGVRNSVDVDELLVRAERRWASVDRVWSVQSSVSTALADEERVEAALDALIENAVKFTDPGQPISVRAWVDDDDLVVEVSDGGAGIPRDDLERIFATFTTGRAAGDKAGSGLGLAIVRAAVEGRQGSVEVSSEVGVGTTFTLRFDRRTSLVHDWSEPVLQPTDPSLRRNGGADVPAPSGRPDGALVPAADRPAHLHKRFWTTKLHPAQPAPEPGHPVGSDA